MGIYWYAVDDSRKERFEPPNCFANKRPGIFHPQNPFPQMIIMMNSMGCNFELINDGGWDERVYDKSYKDITIDVYKKLIEEWPEFKEFYENKD